MLAACGDSSPAPMSGDAGIDSMPMCPLASTLKVTLDGSEQPDRMITAAATGHAITLKQSAPGYVLTLTADGWSTSTTFPSKKVDVTFGPLNTTLPVGQSILKTRPDTAENVFLPMVEGSLSLVHLGSDVGENRCGTADLTLTWADTDPKRPHTTRVEGEFSVPVAP